MVPNVLAVGKMVLSVLQHLQPGTAEQISMLLEQGSSSPTNGKGGNFSFLTQAFPSLQKVPIIMVISAGQISIP